MNSKTDIERLGRQMMARALASDEQRFGSFFLSRLLGFDLAYENEKCIVSFCASPLLGNPQGSLHGGVMATAMDISMGHLLERQCGSGATLDFSIKYLAPVPWGQVHAEGQFLRKGRSIAFLESNFFQANGTLSAVATATWKIRSKSINS